MALFKIATVLAAVALTAALAAPGVAEDKATQPYEFEYGVSTAGDPRGNGQQGHAEARVGDHSIGNYFVRLPEQGSASNVKYTTDLWGFHPDVEYETPNSKTKLTFGDRAVAQATRADFPGNLPVSIDAASKVASFDVDDTLSHLAAAGNPPIPEKLANELDKAKHSIAVSQSVPPAPGKFAYGQKTFVAADPIAPVIKTPAYGAVAPVVHHDLPAVQPISPVVQPVAPVVHSVPAVQPVVPALQNFAQPSFHVQPAPIFATPAPFVQRQPFVQTALPLASPTPIAPVAAFQPQLIQPVRPSYSIIQQQKQVKPIVVAEFNSNNHILANHAPLVPAQTYVSTTPAPLVSYGSPTPTPIVSYASPTPAPIVSYASPTPAPAFIASTPRPVIHHDGGFLASTLAPPAYGITPAAYGVTPAPLKLVSPTPQPAFLHNIDAEITHHAQPLPHTVLVDRPVPVEVTKLVEKPVHVPVEVTKYVDRPVEVTKYVDRPVPVPQYVDRPVEVTKFVDRPVEVTKYVDRPVHVTKFVDRPVEVTKYVDRPYEVTKFVDRPVEVTKYVDRPVEVIKHVPVEKPVYVPGPTIEKHVPVPVTKVVHVDRPIPQPYAVPQPIAVPQPVPVPVREPVPYAQYVLNVPYGGRFTYGKARIGDVRDGSYAEAALKLDAWKAEQASNRGGYFGGYGFRSEGLLKPACGYGCGGGYRTETADIKGFKVSKTYLADSDIVPVPGPTKVTLTVEPHVHKTELGRALCTEGFKPPFVPSRLLSEGFDEKW